MIIADFEYLAFGNAKATAAMSSASLATRLGRTKEMLILPKIDEHKFWILITIKHINNHKNSTRNTHY